jgi:hypothetical protein
MRSNFIEILLVDQVFLILTLDFFIAIVILRKCAGKRVYFILYAYYARKENLTRFNKNYVALLIIMCICHNYIFHNYVARRCLIVEITMHDALTV